MVGNFEIDGVTVGIFVGRTDGDLVGSLLGIPVGILLGGIDGAWVGSLLGIPVGILLLGTPVGILVG